MVARIARSFLIHVKSIHYCHFIGLEWASKFIFADSAGALLVSRLFVLAIYFQELSYVHEIARGVKLRNTYIAARYTSTWISFTVFHTLLVFLNEICVCISLIGMAGPFSRGQKIFYTNVATLFMSLLHRNLYLPHIIGIFRVCLCICNTYFFVCKFLQAPKIKILSLR